MKVFISPTARLDALEKTEMSFIVVPILNQIPQSNPSELIFLKSVLGGYSPIYVWVFQLLNFLQTLHCRFICIYLPFRTNYMQIYFVLIYLFIF
jgi:hypothetical protein